MTPRSLARGRWIDGRSVLGRAVAESMRFGSATAKGRDLPGQIWVFEGGRRRGAHVPRAARHEEASDRFASIGAEEGGDDCQPSSMKADWIRLRSIGRTSLMFGLPPVCLLPLPTLTGDQIPLTLASPGFRKDRTPVRRQLFLSSRSAYRPVPALVVPACIFTMGQFI